MHISLKICDRPKRRKQFCFTVLVTVRLAHTDANKSINTTTLTSEGFLAVQEVRWILLGYSLDKLTVYLYIYSTCCR